jgi:hypothetical protein
VGKPEGNRSLGRTKRRWENNTKMGVTEIGCGGVEQTQVRDQRRALVNTVMNLRVVGKV